MSYYKMGWIGTAAFQVLDGNRELVFDLAEGLHVPPEFKEGDDVDVILHSDMIGASIGHNEGFYEVIHLKTGTKFNVPHQTSEWRFK